MMKFITLLLISLVLSSSALVIDHDATIMSPEQTAQPIEQAVESAETVETVQEQETPESDQQESEQDEMDLDNHLDTRVMTVDQMESELGANGLTNEDVQDVMAIHRISQDATDENGKALNSILDTESTDERAQGIIRRLVHKALQSNEEQEQQQAQNQVSDSDSIPWSPVYYRFYKDRKGYHAGTLNVLPNKKYLRYLYMAGIAYDRINPLPVGYEVNFRRPYFWKDLKMKVVAQLNPGRGTQAMMLEDPENKLLHVLFRGSEASGFREFYRDWVATDANVFLDPCRFNGETAPGECHRGFMKAFNVLANSEYHQMLEKYHNKGWSLTFVGHSLGGALANMAAYHAKEHSCHRVHRVVTFGAPRTGDATFAKAFDNELDSVSKQFVNTFSTAACIKIGYSDAQVSDANSREFAMRAMLKQPEYYRDWLNELHSADAEIQDQLPEHQPQHKELQDSDEWWSWPKLPSLTYSDGRKGTDVVSRVPPEALGYRSVGSQESLRCPKSCRSFCCGLRPSRAVATISCHLMEDYYQAMGASIDFATN